MKNEHTNTIPTHSRVGVWVVHHNVKHFADAHHSKSFVRHVHQAQVPFLRS